MTGHGTALKHAIDLFNCGRFFDAHEALEDLWRELPAGSSSKRHYQGLVQVAVALHHESCGNLRGAGAVLERALLNLAGAGDSFESLDIEGLCSNLAAWQRYLADGKRRPQPPQIADRRR